jgi:hypothetical protein
MRRVLQRRPGHSQVPVRFHDLSRMRTAIRMRKRAGVPRLPTSMEHVGEVQAPRRDFFQYDVPRESTRKIVLARVAVL